MALPKIPTDDELDEMQGPPLLAPPNMMSSAPASGLKAKSATDDGMAQPIPRIGDDTPLGRFAMPILPAPPPPQVESFEQGDRNAQRQTLLRDQAKRTAPHLGEEGSAHPGIFGKFLHGLATAGNIAGDIFAPATMSLIPGTDLNNSIRLNSDKQGIAALDKEDTGDALEQVKAKQQAQEEADKTRLTDAQVGNLNSETQERDNPKPQYEIHDTEAGPLFVNKRTGEAQHLSANGLPIGPKVQTKTVQLQIGGKPHQVLINDATGLPIKDLGESGEKPPVTNINQGTWQLEEGGDGKPVLFNSKTGKTEAAPDIAKPGTHAKATAPYQTIVDDAQTAHQLAAAAEAGNAPADVDLALAFFKAMRGSGGAGIRFTQAEQNLIMGARNSAGDLMAVGQKVLGGGQKFTPEQRNNILKVIDLHAQVAQKHLDGGGENTSGPKAGEVDNGYRFNGGDPANQGNWEKVK